MFWGFTYISVCYDEIPQFLVPSGLLHLSADNRLVSPGSFLSCWALGELSADCMSQCFKQKYLGCHNLLPQISIRSISIAFSVTQVYGSYWPIGNLARKPSLQLPFRYTIQTCFLRNLQTSNCSNSPNFPDIQAFLFSTISLPSHPPICGMREGFTVFVFIKGPNLCILTTFPTLPPLS